MIIKSLRQLLPSGEMKDSSTLSRALHNIYSMNARYDYDQVRPLAVHPAAMLQSVVVVGGGGTHYVRWYA